MRVKTDMRSSSQSRDISEEPYCVPWDLTIQAQKLKLLNEQQPILTNVLLHPSNHIPSYRTRSTHKSSSIKKSLIHRESSFSIFPSLPSSNFMSSDSNLQHRTVNNNNSIIGNLDASPSTEHIKRINTMPPKIDHFKNSQKLSLLTDNPKLIPSEAALLRFSSTQNNSLPDQKSQTVYDQPWNTLQKEQHCPLSIFRNISPCRHNINTEGIHNEITIPIDRCSWYHYAMPRREAEHVLQSCTPGSFLVRQSESGNQNDYSLSIRTVKGCLHMRICYSTGVYILGECSRPFSSVSRMIEYFSQTSVPIRGATHIKLGTPVLRWDILLSDNQCWNEEFL